MNAIIIPSTQALSVEFLAQDPWALPERTVDGVVCGGCTRVERQFRGFRAPQVRHASVAHVKLCHEHLADMAAEAKAELDAEAAGERFWEERGYEEARAQEAHEARMGIFA